MLKCKNIFISTLIDKIYQYLLLIDNIYDTLVYAILKPTIMINRINRINNKDKRQDQPDQPQPEKRTPNQQKRPQPVKYNR